MAYLSSRFSTFLCRAGNKGLLIKNVAARCSSSAGVMKKEISTKKSTVQGNYVSC